MLRSPGRGKQPRAEWSCAPGCLSSARTRSWQCLPTGCWIGASEGGVMPDDDIEIGEDIQVEVVLDEDDNVLGTVTDDVVVASAPEGSLVDETIDVRDADGNLIVEDETVTVYDEDAHVVGRTETVTLPIDSE